MTKTIGSMKIGERGEREIVITRVFDAPREMVFDAYTKCDLLKRWLGLVNDNSLIVCRMDLKVGGTYRFVWLRPEGKEMGLRGVFREVIHPERMVSTETWDEPWYPGEAHITTVLTEEGGKTTLTTTLRYESEEARDGVLETPMAQGLSESFDLLAEVLASLPVR
jgi:uncharacterized protein YndB with AHSA1/START domain